MRPGTLFAVAAALEVTIRVRGGCHFRAKLPFDRRLA
jgi:hypothetical protein